MTFDVSWCSPEVGERGLMGEFISLSGGSWQGRDLAPITSWCHHHTSWFWSDDACFGPVASQDLLSSILGHSSIPHLFVFWGDQKPSLLNLPA